MPPLSNQEEPIKRMTKIVNAFLARPDSGPFREPVDWRGLELHDYPEIIKHMMDLGTIKRKLDRGQYQTAHQVAQDIRLVWNNCMTYNAEGSDFWLLAKAFSRRFEDRYRKIVRDHDVGEDLEQEAAEEEADDVDEAGEDDEEEDDDEEEAEFDDDDAFSGRHTETKSENGSPKQQQQQPTLDDRARFSSNLLLLSGIELGYIVKTIECECPQAIEIGQAVPEKLEILVDELDGALFAKLSQYASEKASQRKRKLPIPSPNNVPPINDISNKRKRKR